MSGREDYASVMGGATRTVAPDLVGREREQRALAETVDQVALGSGAIALLTGEVGVGKTRLAQYALDVARAKGFTVLRGRSQPFDVGLAYVPVIEAFGRHLRACSAAERVGLVSGLPVLGRLFDGLDLPPVEPLDDRAWEKTRLYEALLRLLGRISDRSPVALLLDDAHWADRASLEVFGYMLRDLPALPVLLIVTCRREGTDSRTELGTFIQLARRTGVMEELPVERLSTDNVRVLLTRLLDGPAAVDLADLVAARSEGVPLFVEAFARWLYSGQRIVRTSAGWTLRDRAGAGVPPAVREIILAELARLPEQERAVADLIAVGGDHATARVLGPVGRSWMAGLDVDETLSSLLAAGRIVEDAEGGTVRYRFPHPLLHEVIYGSIPISQRRQLHLLIAAELQGGDDVAGQAAHWLAAGPDTDPASAAEVFVAAGQRALDGYAFDEARTFFQAAVTRAEDTRVDLIEPALVGLADALLRANQLGAAARAYRRLLDHPNGPREPRRRARLYAVIAHCESQRGDLAAAERDIEDGLAELAGLEPGDETISLLVARQAARHRATDLAGVREAKAEIAELGSRIGTPLATEANHMAELLWRLEQGDYPSAQALVGRAINLYRPPWNKAVMLGWRALVAAALGDLAALSEANRAITAFERDLGTFAWSYRGALYRFVEAFYRGEWDVAAEAFEPVLADDRADSPRMVATAVMFKPLLAAFQADFDTAQHWLLEGRALLAAGRTAAQLPRAIHNLVAALVALEQDQPDVALELIGRNGDYLLTSVIPPWSLVILAEARAKTGQVEPARQATAQLARCGSEGSYPRVMATRLDGLIQLAGGQPAAAMLLQARDGFVQLGMPFEAVRVTIEAAEAALAVGELGPTVLVEDVVEAHRTLVRLSAGRYVRRAARVLRTLGVPVPPPDPAPGEELTARQWEVAGLAAKGLSNAAIAERLVVSVRTVTSHLEHIYARLGINSRAALASYVTATRAPTARR
jgi:DNA-binding CsgD family transcriptional regulator/tetratricopeptide (TPR) repeat protein